MYLYVVYLDTVHIISFEGTVEHKNSVIFSFACCLDPNDILSPVKQKKGIFLLSVLMCLKTLYLV